MSTSIGLALNAGELPYNCYPATPQQLYNDMFSLGSALSSNVQGVVIQQAKPSADQQNLVWIKLDSSGNPTNPMAYIFVGGQWVSPHPVPSAGQERRIWMDTIAALNTYDGGDNNAAGPASGPMWAVDSSWPGLFPIAVGQVPDGGPALNVNDSGGLTHLPAIVRDNLPTDRIEIGVPFGGVAEPAGMSIGQFNVPSSQFTWNPGTDPVLVGYTNKLGKGTLVGPFMEPYKAVYFIKRTSRIYYVG